MTTASFLKEERRLRFNKRGKRFEVGKGLACFGGKAQEESFSNKSKPCTSQFTSVIQEKAAAVSDSGWN